MFLLYRIETAGLAYRGEVCVEFAYHMRGDSMGRLEVRTSGGEEAVWERSGEQGDSWNTATVTVNINSGDKVSHKPTLCHAIFCSCNDDITLISIMIFYFGRTNKCKDCNVTKM